MNSDHLSDIDLSNANRRLTRNEISAASSRAAIGTRLGSFPRSPGGAAGRVRRESSCKIPTRLPFGDAARAFVLSVLWLHAALSCLSAAEPIIFETAIAPLLRQNCIACHHAKNAEGGLNLESFASLSRGGDSGLVIDAKEPDKSLLLDRVTGRVESIMPPIDNTVDAKPLSPEQVGLLKQWIESGAISKASESPPDSENRSLPDIVQASYAITITPDNRWLVFARGNDLIFHPIADWSQLATAISQQRIMKDAHRDSCFALAASPDGQRVASGSTGEVKIWRRHEAVRISVATTDGPYLSEAAYPTAGATTTDADEKKRLTFEGSAVVRMIASKDGSTLATLDESERLRLWHAPNASLVQEHLVDRAQSNQRQRIEADIERQKRRIERWNAKLVELKAVVDKESKAVEAAKQAREVADREWQTKQQELKAAAAAIPEHEKSIAAVQAAVDVAKQMSIDLKEKKGQAADETSKLENAIGGTQTLIDLGNQKLAELTAQLEQQRKTAADLEKQEAAAKAKSVAAEQALEQRQESHRLAIVAVDQKQAQIDPEPKVLDALIAELEQYPEHAELAISSVAMTFIGNGQRLVSISPQNQLEIYSTHPFQRIAPPISLTGKPHSIQSIEDHDVLLRDSEQHVERWSIAPRWELECTLGRELPTAISDRVNALAFNHDGTQLAIGSGFGSRTGHLAILEIGEPQAESLSANAVQVKWSEPELHSDTVLGLAYSPDGRLLASGGADKMIKLVDLSILKPIRNLEGHTHHVLGVAWQGDGLYLSSTSGDGTIKIWDSESGETTRTLNIGKELTALSFIGNSTRFVSTVIDHSVRMHDIQSNDQIRQFGAAQNALYSVAVSPDGRFVVASGQEGIPRAWQIEDGKLVAEIKAP